MIRTLLWDADGVLQHAAEGWDVILERARGDGFADAVFAAEGPALRGEASLREVLADVVRRWPRAGLDVDDLVTLWENAVPDPEALALVAQVRAGGVRCVLATNQQDHRRAWMRDVLDLDRHFDEVFYSCEVGAAKPEADYFHRVLAALGLGADEVAFVDDSADNIAQARRLGIRAVRHDPASGTAALRQEVHELLSGRGSPAARR